MNRILNTSLALSFLFILCSGTVQAQPAVKAKAPAAQTGPQDPDKFDTSLPVEISSDSLEVLQHENKAIFKGNVVAVQGQVRLKSDTMIVHYKQKDQQAQPAKPAQAPAGQGTQGEMGAITLIEVVGNVFVATPQESAKGDKGDYDVPTRVLHLFGDNVVLTRDKNLMRGTALEYNMATGRSILTNGTKVVGGQPTGTRVRSVFVPSEEQDQNGKPAKGDAGKSGK